MHVVSAKTEAAAVGTVGTAPAKKPGAPSTRGAAARGLLTRRGMLDLQRLAGNRAVQRLATGGVLRVGSSGPPVSQLQSALNAAGASLTVDGAFGPGTRAAVVAFQQAAGLGADGVAGPKTQQALAAGGVSIGGGPPQGPAGPDPRLATLRGLVAAISKHLGGSAGGGSGTPAGGPQVEPEVRQGWFDDAVDWVEETAGEVATAVGDAAGSAVDAVGEAVGGAADWVQDTAGATASAVGDAVGGAASWVAETAGDAAETVTAAAGQVMAEAASMGNQLQSLVGDIAGQAGPALGRLVTLLQEAGSGVGLSGGSLDDLIRQATTTLAEVSGAEPLGGGAGTGTLSMKVTRGTGANFTFNDETFGALRATLTARTTEIGNAQPSTPALTVDGQDASSLPGDQKITNAVLTVNESVTLPSWTNENSAKVQDAQRAAWARYTGDVSAHEDLHVADDRGIYEAAAKSLPGKTVTQAFAIIDKATDAGNAQRLVRDRASPAPTLNPAGVEKV